MVATKSEAFRDLTPEEKEELVRRRQMWGQPFETDDAEVLSRFGSYPMIDDFAFFIGIPGQQSVSEAIEVILVPDATMKAQVVEFIAQNASAFRGDGGPVVRIFPSPTV